MANRNKEGDQGADWYTIAHTLFTYSEKLPIIGSHFYKSWGYLNVYTYDLNSIRVSIDLHLSVLRNFYSVIESVS